MRIRSRSVLVAGLALLLWPVVGRAQFPVDQPVGQVDNRVGGELYGNNTAQPYPQPYQTRLLPSEERYAIWRSGVLPSELEMNRTSAGPLTPNGVLDYLPRRSALQQAMGLPESRLFNPAYDATALRSRRLDNDISYGPQAGYPQTFRAGLAATTNMPGRMSANNRLRQQQTTQQQNAKAEKGQPQQQQAVPSLVPIDRALPTGQLMDDVNYNPNSTPGAVLLNRRLNVRPAQPATKPASLADEKK